MSLKVFIANVFFSALLVSMQIQPVSAQDASGGVLKRSKGQELPAQPGACRKVFETCGDKVVNESSKKCCEGITCYQGTCLKYQQIEKPCGKEAPPCYPGLKCRGGYCQ